jgi:phosphopantothenoylcysteine decarboxylase/phosphopantothenate--cysteine ligase
MKILVTAGPTRESLDPVRFLSNRSTGKMGYAVADAARDAGHETVLISGPVPLDAPSGVTVVSVVSADDMLMAVQDNLQWCDVLIMAAAVADWRPATVSAVKLKKSGMRSRLELERTPDILKTIMGDKGSRVFVGFAAETGNPVAEAGRKLVAKGLDIIVANDVAEADSGFAVDTNRVILLFSDGRREDWPLMSKAEVAKKLVMELKIHGEVVKNEKSS